MDYFLSLSALDLALYTTIIILWSFSALADYLHFTHLWQLKEYRIDRFRDYLQSEKGKEFARSYRVFLRPLVLLFVFTFLADQLHIHYIILALFASDALYNIYCYKNRALFRPLLTAKASIIVLIALFIEAIVATTLYPIRFIFILFVGRFFFHGLLVAILQFPTAAIKQVYILLAKRKIKAQSNLVSIGITGSYGKSSVKEFTSHLLSKKYKVIKTPGNINTEIGVARFILNNDFSEKDIFVCEMGAYKMGEIQKICNMVSPKIGVLTAINEQHLSLFGSILKTQKAKYELLRSIPADGLVITNADNSYCTEFLGELDCRNQLLFGSDEENNPDVLITDITSSLKGNNFNIQYQQKEYRIETKLVGAHHAYNVTASLLAALHFGMSIEDIITQAKTLPIHSHGSIEIYQYGKATIIDDSYNSNPRGFVSALELMSKFPSERKRIVITRGMLELGEQSQEIHERVGGEITFVADELIVTTTDSYEWLRKGVGKKYQTHITLKTDPDDLLKHLKTLKEEQVVILLENKIHPRISTELESYKPKSE